MKTLEQIFKQAPVFLHDWKSKIDIIANFEDVNITNDEYHANKPNYDNVEYYQRQKQKMDIVLKRWVDVHILFASYYYADYSGDAFVLFESNNKLYEVNGAHCSCYGLEGQWEPEETTLESLQLRLIKGTMGDHHSQYINELKEFLGIEK